MLTSFQVYITQHRLQPPAHVLVACSGGIDSVVLCEMCHQAQLSFSIAHCNFGLRGQESDRDEAFVKNLSENYNVPVYTKQFDTAAYGRLKKVSVQEAARELRYNWFEAVRIETGAAAVLLAHQANDNVETVLMHLFRGTGLHGLTGMPAQTCQGRCLRPLLHHTRREIETFAKNHSLQWVDDSSNASSKYTRNFFRNEILPAVKNAYPQAEQNILDTIARLQKTEVLYQTLLHGLLKKFVIENSVETKVPVHKLLQYANTALPYELFKRFGFGEKQLPQLLQLAKNDSGAYLQNETHRVIKHRNWLLIAPLASPDAGTFVIEDGVRTVQLPAGELQIKTLSRERFHLDASPETAQLDLARIQFPLLVRRWKTGDYFYPLGMRKKKKLARFFIDQKLSAPQKESIWIVESASRIVWIIGHRIDDRAKVTDTTKEMLQLRFAAQK